MPVCCDPARGYSARASGCSAAITPKTVCSAGVNLAASAGGKAPEVAQRRRPRQASERHHGSPDQQNSRHSAPILFRMVDGPCAWTRVLLRAGRTLQQPLGPLSLTGAGQRAGPAHPVAADLSRRHPQGFRTTSGRASKQDGPYRARAARHASANGGAGDRGRARTGNPQLRRLMLDPIGLRGQNSQPDVTVPF